MNDQPTPKPPTPAEAKSLEIAQRIWTEFKWNLKKMDMTWLDVALLIDTAMKLCHDEIPDKVIRRAVVERFRHAKGKVLRFAEKEEKANVARLTGEACVKCGHEFQPEEPKTWIADGQFTCSKCQ